MSGCTQRRLESLAVARFARQCLTQRLLLVLLGAADIELHSVLGFSTPSAMGSLVTHMGEERLRERVHGVRQQTRSTQVTSTASINGSLTLVLMALMEFRRGWSFINMDTRDVVCELPVYVLLATEFI